MDQVSQRHAATRQVPSGEMHSELPSYRADSRPVPSIPPLSMMLKTSLRHHYDRRSGECI